MEKDASSSRTAALICGGVAALAALYFTAPVVYQIPLEVALRQGILSYSAIFDFFMPIRAVGERVPEYEHWTTGQYVFGVEHDWVAYELY